jgi:hypothetical protein
MRWLLSFALLLLVTPAFAQTPEQVAKGYMEAMRSGDMEHVATYMHPAGLEKFKLILVQAAEVLGAADASADPRTDTALKVLFGQDGPQSAKDAAAKELFVRFLDNLHRAAPMMQRMLADSSYEFIGHVDEGGNQTHVVYRVTMNTGGASVTKLEVLSLKRDGEEWKVMLTGEIEGLLTGLTRPAPHK